MKRAVILHGWEGNHTLHWYPWLSEQLKARGYQVWSPDLPDPDFPSVRRWNEFLTSQHWDFQDNLLIGHSAGAVEILGFLQALPRGLTIDTAVLVSVFSAVMPEESDYHNLRGLFEESFNYPRIKTKAKQFIVVHGDNDPLCALEDAKTINAQLDGSLHIIPRGKHFITEHDSKWQKFPELIQIMEQRRVI